MFIKVGMIEASQYDLIDLDTNKRIPLVQSGNDKTGYYTVVKSIDGTVNTIQTDYFKGKLILEVKKGNIKFVKKGQSNG